MADCGWLAGWRRYYRQLWKSEQCSQSASDFNLSGVMAVSGLAPKIHRMGSNVPRFWHLTGDLT